MILDVHAHIFPQAIAQKAAGSIGHFYDTSGCGATRGDGTSRMLIEDGAKVGVTAFCVHSVATTPHQVASINRFLASEMQAHPGTLFALGALHPDSEDIPGDIGRIEEAGLLGVKLHPDMQRFPIDGEASIRMLRHLAERGYPLLVHAGDFRYHYSNPVQIARLMDALPDLTVIAAHMGGYSEWEEAVKCLAGRGDRLFVDCSSTMYAHTDAQMVDLIRAFGTKQVLFGSDYPMWVPSQELPAFLRLVLTEEERRDILWNNALRIPVLGAALAKTERGN